MRALMQRWELLGVSADLVMLALQLSWELGYG
jgi:hypothetical protein